MTTDEKTIPASRMSALLAWIRVKWLNVGTGYKILFSVFLGAVFPIAVIGLIGTCEWKTFVWIQDEAKISPPWTLISALAAVPTLLLLWYWRDKQKRQEIENRQNEILNQRKTIENTENQLATARFSEAAKLLSDRDHVEMRLAGIFALERMARDSPAMHIQVFDLLAAFARTYSKAWSEEDMGYELASRTKNKAKPPKGGRIQIDVQAAVEAIGHRKRQHDKNTEIDLQGASVPFARFDHCDFSNVSLVDCDMRRCRIRSAVFDGASCENIQLSNTVIADSSFVGANCSSAKCNDAVLIRVKFEKAELSTADFKEAFAGRVNFSEANLDSADFSQCRATNTSFEKSNLVAAKLLFHHLNSCSFRGAKYNTRSEPPDPMKTEDEISESNRYYTSFCGEIDPDKEGMVNEVDTPEWGSLLKKAPG